MRLQLYPGSGIQLVQPSMSTSFPSSHYSPVSLMAFPQTASIVQYLLQPSPSIKLPSSHYSSPIFILSPHIGVHGVIEYLYNP